MVYRIYSIIIFNLISLCLFAQKKPLDHSVYDGWQSIKSAKGSLDGQFILYSITPQEGDAQLIISTVSGETIWTVPRGENGLFTDNSQYAIVTIKPPFAETRLAKIKKKKENEMPKDSLAIISLLTKNIYKAPRVKSFKLADESSEYIAYLTEETAKADSVEKDTKGKKGGESGTLHLRNLATGAEELFEHVSDYSFDNAARVLAFARTGKKDVQTDNAGLFLYTIQEKKLKQISRGRGTYRQITFDQTGTQLAFTAEKSPEKALQKPYSLYYYTPERDTANIIANVSSTGMPNNWNVSGDGKLRFSKSGEKLFFGIAPIPRIKDTTIVDFEVANVDIWTWKDDYLQPQQLVNLKKDLTKSYLSVIYPKRNATVIPLASLDIPEIELTDDADNQYALGSTNAGKRVSAQWEGSTKQDFYLISTTDGSKTKIASDVYARPFMSPLGKFVVWYNMATQQWNAYDVNARALRTLNTDLPVSFSDEDNDSPTFARPYGIAGWTPEDKEVLIYDKYDIWSFDPKGNDRRILTNGAGRSTKITFRYEDILPKTGRKKHDKAVIIDTKKPILVSAFNHLTKEGGWFETNPRNKKDPKEIVMSAHAYKNVSASIDKNVIIYTKENYKESPNLYVTSSEFKRETKLSAINPQQEQYNWGTAELVKWTTPAGHEATGILYKPEDFSEAKKYPMITYFYEKLSDGLNTYIAPAPTPSRLNISYFVSNGYLVFAPDISYEIGHPGKSAEEYINSGVKELAKFAWVDEKHLGIQGQSWGGYQVAHLITRTDMYAAAWAGAPVVNMTSAYGGIRWATGLNRQFQYEKTQSRIGKDLWEGYDLYIENSPLFHLKTVKTPVVVMANDNDGAVPWYQGIEMFTALRRLSKPVWLLNYNGEEHNLVKRQNRKDIQIREQQFFDHFLKEKPAPVWLERGVPATLKGIDWGFDLID
ncbi:prolyl oligopeptidase family serine peptidase [Olivibacter sp. XZL3]|uniref:S9 family peptidase n=1 Tax=Olivibacter sp. XZL3 TaxID=1735116 RepID=UPI00141703B2|nr:prolyl oligopeptidase family serine peptidase [Olivibacter sp. XZL3]